MTALISGPRALSAFFLAVVMVHPSLHFGDLVSRRMTRTYGCVPAPLPKGRVKLLEGGLIVKYQCRRGTILWGAKYATCMSGEWDQKPPICVQRGCRPLAPLPLGSIMVTLQGAVALLKCRQGHYLATKSYAVLGRVIMNLRNETSDADYIYCDGRVWNATEYHCIPIPTTTTSPTPATTTRGATSSAPNLVTTPPDLTVINVTTTTTAYPETSTPVQPLRAGTMAWATEGGVEAGKGTTADLGTPPPLTATFSPWMQTNPRATTARFLSPIKVTSFASTLNKSTTSPTAIKFKLQEANVSSSSPLLHTPSSSNPSRLHTTQSYMTTIAELKTLGPPTWCDFSGNPVMTSVWKRLPGSLELYQVGVRPISVLPTCGWNSYGGPMNMTWELDIHGESGASIPSWKEPGGSNLQVTIAGDSGNNSEQAVVISPFYKLSTFAPGGSLACFSFWYKALNGILQLVILSNGTTSRLWMDRDLWSTWNFVSVALNPPVDEFRIGLIAQGTSSDHGFVAVDNLWLANTTECEAIKWKYTTENTASTPRLSSRLGPGAGSWANSSVTTPFSRRTPSQGLWTNPLKRNGTTTGIVAPTAAASQPPTTRRPTTFQMLGTRPYDPRGPSLESPVEGSHLSPGAEESFGGIPWVVIWSVAAVSAVAMVLLAGFWARRLVIRRRAKVREGGDGDSDVRYHLSDEDRLDLNLKGRKI